MHRYSLTSSIICLLLLLSCNKHISDTRIKTIKHLSIKDVKLLYDAEALKIAGSKFQIGLELTDSEGKKHRTKGWLGGDIRWSNFKIRINYGYRIFDKIQIYENMPYSCKHLIVTIKDRKRKGIDVAFHINLNQIEKVKLFALNNFPKAPGRFADLGIEYTYDCGIIVNSLKKNKRSKEFKDFEVHQEGGYLRGTKFHITNDIFAIKNHQVGIVAVFKHDKLIKDTFTIQLDYIDDYAESFYGKEGEPGSMGMGGFDGYNAQCGGCSGGDGTAGTNGTGGFQGYRGPSVNVFAEAYFDKILNCDLVKLRVDNVERRSSSFYLLNPNGGTLTVDSYGGRGGSGGHGGHGGKGGDGSSGNTYTVKVKVVETEKDSTGKEIRVVKTIDETRYTAGGHGGNGGAGGHGGEGGMGGPGGEIVVACSEGTEKYRNTIKIYSMTGPTGFAGLGGSGGYGGKGGHGSPQGRDGSRGRYGIDGYGTFKNRIQSPCPRPTIRKFVNY